MHHFLIWFPRLFMLGQDMKRCLSVMRHSSLHLSHRVHPPSPPRLEILIRRAQESPARFVECASYDAMEQRHADTVRDATLNASMPPIRAKQSHLGVAPPVLVKVVMLQLPWELRRRNSRKNLVQAAADTSGEPSAQSLQTHQTPTTKNPVVAITARVILLSASRNIVINHSNPPQIAVRSPAAYPIRLRRHPQAAACPALTSP